MRDIKFRAWNKDLGRMSKPFSLKYNILNFCEDDGLGLMCSISDEEVMQYTGVTDHYGVEVYEGDWLTARGAKPEHGAQVVWSKTISAFVIDIPDGPVISQDYVDLYSLVVTGNIYQNPELLEQRQ